VPRSRASPLTPHRGAGQLVGAMHRADENIYTDGVEQSMKRKRKTYREVKIDPMKRDYVFYATILKNNYL
jgi:hypothetical protein